MPHLAARDVHVWHASLDVSPAASARFYATLSSAERERAARLRFKRDQQRFIAAHGVLRALLGRYLAIAPQQPSYVYNPSGKPELAPQFGGRLMFNLSHSADCALIALAANVEVGVDIEAIREQRDYAEIARHCFTLAEVAQLNRLPGHLYATAFLGCWTRKEAYLKARGVGLGIPLNSFSVLPAAAPEQWLANPDQAAEGDDALQPWSLFALQLPPGYVGALAIAGHGWHLSQYQWQTPA